MLTQAKLAATILVTWRGRGAAIMQLVKVLATERGRLQRDPKRMKKKSLLWWLSQHLIPKITEHDYDAFRHFISTDLPKTYKEWLRLKEQASSPVLLD